MANTNTLTAVLDRILAPALDVLREACVMPRLVNSTFSDAAGGQGSTLELSVAGDATVSDVTPSNTPPDSGGVTPTTVVMNLDKWKESGFFMSDKDLMDIRGGVLPAQAAACVRKLANQVNTDILATYTGVYGYVGSAGTTPFATGLDEASQARKVLAQQLCPLSERRGVIDPDAEANFILIPAVLNAEKRGDTEGIKEGRISRILGIDWFMDQAIPTHTTGAAGTPLLDDSAARAVGIKTLHMDGFTTKPSVGDIFTIAGDNQTYTVTASTTLVGTDSDVSFEPGLKVAIPAVDGNEVVTFKASHKVNLVLNREAIGFANRPFNGELMPGMSAANVGNFSYMQDPVSGLVLRVEVTREHKRTKLSFDMLYGVKLIDAARITRIAG